MYYNNFDSYSNMCTVYFEFNSFGNIKESKSSEVGAENFKFDCGTNCTARLCRHLKDT